MNNVLRYKWFARLTMKYIYLTIRLKTYQYDSLSKSFEKFELSQRLRCAIVTNGAINNLNRLEGDGPTNDPIYQRIFRTLTTLRSRLLIKQKGILMFPIPFAWSVSILPGLCFSFWGKWHCLYSRSYFIISSFLLHSCK